MGRLAGLILWPMLLSIRWSLLPILLNGLLPVLLWRLHLAAKLAAEPLELFVTIEMDHDLATAFSGFFDLDLGAKCRSELLL